MSSMQVNSWDNLWRRSIFDLEPWDVELPMLSERTRGLSIKESIFAGQTEEKQTIFLVSVNFLIFIVP